VVDRLIPGERYNRRCPHCETPYRQEDYRADAEHIYCPVCRCELPRHAASVTDSTVQSPS
jgi:hypothetical protein